MALKYMRDNLKNLKWVLWFVVFVFIALVFVDWGSGRAGGGGDNVALRIGDRQVSEQEFLQDMRESERRFQSVYGAKWQQIRDRINLAEQTKQRLIQRELMVQEAEHAGLVVTRKELTDQILSFPAFRRENGSFVGEDVYARILRANQTTTHEFETKLRSDLLIEKLRQSLEGGVVVSDATVRETIQKDKDSADLDIIPVRFGQFLDKVQAEDTEVEAYYKAHADEFKRDEQRVIRYLVVETNTLRRSLPVNDDEIAAYYNEHKSDFMEPEKAHARHILLRVPPGATDAQKAEIKLKAEGVAKIARSGADFAELAKKYSEDPASKDNGGDLGWFARGRMVKEFEDAVFGHKPGDIVGPVQSQFGYHIIKVEGFQPQRQRPLDEVREEVRFQLLEGRAAAEAESRAAALARTVEKDKPTTQEAWQALADKDDAVELNVSPPFGADEVIPGVGQNPELSAAVFKAKVDDVGGPVAVPRGFIVWQLDEVKPAGVPPLDEIRDDVVAKVRRDKALALAQQAAAKLADQWRGGGDPAELAKEVGSTLTPVAQHRRGTAIPGLGLSLGLDDAVFAAAPDRVLDPVALGERGYLVVKVTKLDAVTPDEMAKEMPQVRARLVTQRVNDLLTSILNERMRATVITVNQQLMDRFAPKTQSS